MSLWLRSQYYCINTTGSCQYALGDVPFSTAEFERFEGVCRGHRADGCGAKLTPGDAQDLRPKWLLAAFLMIAILAGAAWTTQQVFFPPALQHVAFATLRTRTDDRVAVLALEV